jgi:hypothetical protein
MRGQSQEAIAFAMGDGSARSGSRSSAAYHLERSPLTSMTVRTLDRYAEALGGRVVLAVVLGDNVVVLSDPEEA